MGERGDDDALMGEVALAMQTTDLDQSGSACKLDAKRRKQSSRASSFKGLASGVNGPGLRSLKGEAGALSSSALFW